MKLTRHQVAQANERRSTRTEAQGEKRSARITFGADNARLDRIEAARAGWTGRPLRTRTWVSGRSRTRSSR